MLIHELPSKVFQASWPGSRCQFFFTDLKLKGMASFAALLLALPFTSWQRSSGPCAPKNWPWIGMESREALGPLGVLPIKVLWDAADERPASSFHLRFLYLGQLVAQRGSCLVTSSTLVASKQCRPQCYSNKPWANYSLVVSLPKKISPRRVWVLGALGHVKFELCVTQ